MQRKCFVCEKQLLGSRDNSIEQDLREHPFDALCWTSSGGYGSGIFDSFDGSKYLEISICDKCVMKKLNLVTCVESRPLHDDTIVPSEKFFGG